MVDSALSPPAGSPPGSSCNSPPGSPLLTRLTALALRRARLILLATLALAATAALLGAGVAKHLDPYGEYPEQAGPGSKASWSSALPSAAVSGRMGACM
jgi:hypothetical protein